MKNSVFILVVLFTACSSYKKVKVTMSEIQTKNWAGKTESEVINQLGSYKQRDVLDRGYKLIYDYSSYRIPLRANNDVSIHVSNNQIMDNRGNLMVSRTDARPNSMNYNSRNQQLEAVNIKMLEFYFDKEKKVDFVNAMGYPDSIRYELKKK